MRDQTKRPVRRPILLVYPGLILPAAIAAALFIFGLFARRAAVDPAHAPLLAQENRGLYTALILLIILTAFGFRRGQNDASERRFGSTIPAIFNGGAGLLMALHPTWQAIVWLPLFAAVLFAIESARPIHIQFDVLAVQVKQSYLPLLVSLSAFPAFSALHAYKLRLAVVGPLVFILCGLLTYRALRPESATELPVVAYASASAVICLQAFWALTFWDINEWTAGAILSILLWITISVLGVRFETPVDTNRVVLRLRIGLVLIGVLAIVSI